MGWFDAEAVRAVQAAQAAILAQLKVTEQALADGQAALLQAVLDALAGQGHQLSDIQAKEVTLMSDAQATADEIAALTVQVANETTVVGSAETLLGQIKAMLDTAMANAASAGATPDQLAAFADLGARIDQNTSGLAQAVAANTPSV